MDDPSHESPTDRPDGLLEHAGHAADAYAVLQSAAGPLRGDEVADRLVADGLTPEDAAAAVEAVLDHDAVHLLADGRCVDTWVLLDGARLAHRLTATELNHGVLARGVDLVALDHLFDPDEGELFLGEGVHLQDIDPAFDADLLALYDIPVDDVPAEGGWLLVGVDLASAAVDDVIVIAVDDGDATLIGPVSADAAGIGPFDELTAPAVDAALRDGWRAAAQADLDDPDPDLDLDPTEAPVPADELVFEIVAREPRLVGPGSPPFGEVLAARDWVTDGEVVGPPGTDLALWQLTLEVAELAAFYRLDEHRAAALGHLLVMFDSVKAAVEDPDAAGGSGPPAAIDFGADADATLSWLEDPDVASAFVSQAIGIRTDHAESLLRFAREARTQAPKGATVALLWLEAKALNRLGRALEMAERLDDAVRLDREFVPLLLDAANLASDRGDAATAIRHARAAGLSADDDFVQALTEMLPTAPSGLGRNDPCYCGSGRKYKQCHLGRQTVGLEDRAGWLYRKALEWIQDTPWRLRLLEIATAYSPEDEDEEQILHLAMSEPFIADLALSDDGAWADFVDERGVLLPDDERELATRWSGIGRSVYEVTAVDAGVGVAVRDLRGGATPDPDPDTDPDATVTVSERTFSTHATVGDVILARILPAGATAQFFGGIIALGPLEQDGLIELLDAGASGTEIAEHLGSLRGGPRLTNTEGEPLVFCGATYRVPDPDAARAAFDADVDLRPDLTRPTDGDDEGIEPFDAAWVSEITIDGRDWIRARYTLRGDELVIEANSEVRVTRAQQFVVATIAGAELIHEEQRPLDELADTAPIDPRAMLAQPTPELQAVMDEFARSAELQWLDTALPALDDATPRAAADPEHPQHAALLRLLDDLGRPRPADAIAGVDVGRLRAHLGL